MRIFILGLFLCFINLHANALEFLGGEIEIPYGFEGPVTKNMGGGSSVIAFTKPHKGDGTGTLLQITVWDPGQSFPPMSDDELKKGSSKYLLQFLSGIERARSSFTSSDIKFVSISGIPVAKTEWKGKARGKNMHGTMYCYIYDSKIISLHTQDFEKYNGRYTDSVIASFESILIKR